MRTIEYKPSGVCSRQIIIVIDDENTIDSVEFVGGCAGNAIGIGMLVKGMKVDEVIEKLKGINCGRRPTSCPDQLAKALIENKEELEDKKEQEENE